MIAQNMTPALETPSPCDHHVTGDYHVTTKCDHQMWPPNVTTKCDHQMWPVCGCTYMYIYIIYGCVYIYIHPYIYYDCVCVTMCTTASSAENLTNITNPLWLWAQMLLPWPNHPKQPTPQDTFKITTTKNQNIWRRTLGGTSELPCSMCFQTRFLKDFL